MKTLATITICTLLCAGIVQQVEARDSYRWDDVPQRATSTATSLNYYLMRSSHFLRASSVIRQAASTGGGIPGNIVLWPRGGNRPVTKSGRTAKFTNGNASACFRCKRKV